MKGYITRRASHPLNLHLGRPKLDVRRNFFSQRVVEPWNRVPPALKTDRNKCIFKDGNNKFRLDLVNNVWYIYCFVT